MKTKIILFFIILNGLNHCDLFSQDASYLLIKGSVLSRNILNNLKDVYNYESNALIEVYKNNIQIQKIFSDENGDFEIKLPYQNEYVIEISKKDLIKKIFEINTIVPPEYNLNKNATYKFSVSIFPITEGIDLSIFNSPIARIAYYSEKNGFYFNFIEAHLINSKVAEIENMVIVTLKLNKNNFANCIKYAKKAFEIKHYEEALMYFTEASGIYPEEEYPKQKIDEIYKIIIFEKDYQNIILKADNLFNSGAFSQAIDNYRKALSLKQTDKYPAQKIIEINKLIKKIYSDSILFTSLISVADSMFFREKYIDAFNYYQKTLIINPNYMYSIKRIGEINVLLDNEKIFNQNINIADSLFFTKNYDDAKIYYLDALKFKPNNKYLNDKVRRINELNNKYNLIITLADSLYINKKFAISKIKYQESLLIKPSELYPTYKIFSIDSIFKNYDLGENYYKKFILQADYLLKIHDYKTAKTYYEKAIQIDNTKLYPKEKIKEIINKFRENQLYYSNINKADSLFDIKAFTESLIYYKSALNIIKFDRYANKRIYTIDSLLNSYDSNKNNYNTLIKQADEYIKINDFASAQYSLIQASEIFPKEPEIINKISELDTLIDKQTGIYAEYNSLVTKGTNYIHASEYEKAIENFELALKMNPEAKNIAEKITLIKNVMFTIKSQKKESFEKYISIGNSLFIAGMFENAIKNYELALKFKPDEPLTIERIEKIKEIIKTSKTIAILQNPTLVNNNQEFKIYFDNINYYNKTNNYFEIVLTNKINKAFKILMNYGNNNVKNGGIVFKTIISKELGEKTTYIIKIGLSKSWSDFDNNWISFLPLEEDIELINVTLNVEKQ